MDDHGPRRLACAMVAFALGCGAAPDTDLAVAAPRSREVEPSSSEPRQAPAIEVDPEIDAARAWVLSGRERAIVEILEREADGDGEPTIHVVARDGDVVLDASVASTRASALAHWRVAGLVELTRRERIDLLVRWDGWALVTIDSRTMLCGDAAGAPCCALPTPAAAASFACVRGVCTLDAENGEGRIEEWRIEPARSRRRLVRSWPARPDALEGAWDAGARAETGRWQSLDAAERPAVLDDPQLAPPVSRYDEDPDVGGAACVPTVRSAQRDDTVVRAVGCGDPSPLDDWHWPAALVATQAGRTVTTRLSLTALTPDRIVPIGPLASDAIGFVAGESDGGSPGGSSSESLCVLVPGSDARSPRLHRLELASAGSMGLGNQDDGEGYVVGVERARWTFEIAGPGVGRYTRCERWSGTHSRVSDRWRGERVAEPLDVRVTFDPERGFEISDSDRELLTTRCAPE